uniref:Senataxin n=1 Tax=Chelydra serpentina TaxID=8475 RepID=A0A8C3ST80_CHESE
MSTCRWCTPGGSSTTQFLRTYASKTLSPEDRAAANDDLCYCLECVVEYHKARDELPGLLQEILWELETSRLIDHFEKSMKTDIEEDDELFIVDDNGETKLSGYTGPDFENNLRVPLLEILKYPYLLLHEQISELCVEALCKMEQVNFSFQVFDKHPGIYLLLVHPNEVIRRWAILTARNLGKVDRDDYYDLQEVLTCLFKVIELGLFDSPDIYSSSMIEKGKLILLPSHLYDTTNYKNYWLGICMLLTVLEEQAMDSLLLGPDKQNDFMQSILHTMEKQTDDESIDPFWPALHCFMVILDQLGSKVWGQLIDPVQAFQTIINNVSYNNEIKNIRNSSRRTKSEPESNYEEEMVTCSQIVYNYNTEKPKKDTGWKTAICPDYCPNMYEDMQTLANVLQSDIGQDMRVHNSTFLWFIPFVQSLMDLKDLGVAYIVEVIHHLCSEIKGFLSERVQQCDKVSEFFILILVSVVELHRNKKCLHLLWVSSQEWVEAVVKCVKLPTIAFTRCSEKAPGNCPKVTSAISSQASNSVQHACVQLIRSLLREGYQLGQQTVCKQFLDKLNLLLRGSLPLGWQLNNQETQELQMCLKQVIRSIKDRSSNASIPVENSVICTNLPTMLIKQEKGTASDRCQMNIQHRDSLSPPFSLASGSDEACQENETEVRMPVCLSAQSCSSSREDTHKSNGKDGSGSPNSCSKFKKESDKITNLKPQVQNADWTTKLLKLMKQSRSLSGRSSSLPEPLLNKDLNTEIPGQDKKASTLHIDETSANFNVPSSSENKGQIPRNAPLISPLLIKHESTDRLLDFSRYCKREADSEEKRNSEDNAAIACDLVKKKSGSSPLTDSQIDRDLDKLSLAAYAKGVNFPVDSSQERLVHLCDIKRKVKGAFRSSTKGQSNESSSDTDCPNNEVIVISDSSSDEEKKFDIKKPVKKDLCVFPEKQPLTSGCVSDSANKKEQLKTHSSPLPCEEHNSQFFEFETEDDVFSVWQDSQINDEEVNQAQEQDSNLTSTSNCTSDSFELADRINDWGYDTDYISDDVIEKAEEVVERQVDSLSHKKASKTGAKSEATFQEPAIKGNATAQSENFTQPEAVAKDHAKNTGLMEPRASTSSVSLALELTIKKSTLSPCKSLAKSKLVRSALRSPRKMSLKAVQNKKLHQTTSRNTEPCRSTPAVVPPKKVRQCPEPTSTVVKLGLKKAPRKAFELSQRSLDSLTELRSYGKAAGAVQTPQKQKTKLIAPQNLVIKHNRKMLACQDLQFLRQIRPTQVGRGKNQIGSSEGRSKKITNKSDRKHPIQQSVDFDPGSAAGTSEKQKERIAEQICYPSSNDGKKVRKSFSSEREEVQTTPMNKMAPRGSKESNMKIEENNMAVPALQIESYFSSSLTGDYKNEAAEREYVVPLVSPSTPNFEGATLKESKPKLNENSDEDDLFLTQLDPVDMEMCSQMENVGDIIIASEKEPLDAEVDAAESLLQNEPLGIVKCKYRDCREQVEKTGEYCSKHSATDASDHLFVKPSLPLPKPEKPSTTKIFSSNSSSRSANLTKDLENISKPSLSSKAKSNVKSSVPKTGNPKAVSAENQIFKTPSFTSSLRSQSSSNVLRPQNMQTNSTSRFPNRSASGAHSGQERGLPSFPQANALVTQQRDHSIFVTEILKWKYEMFVNFNQFGLPHNLLQSVMVSVPVKFQGYNDYFNTFFPLMMLNAFETVAQEWIENQKTREKNSYHLHLQNFCADLNRADFTACIRESDLAKQLHPKDDDLIFLVVPEKQNSFAEESEMESHLVYHVGFVTRFSRASLREMRQNEQHVVCHLSVQTRGNLSYYINQPVKCVVVSSLVTTQRRFKGLLLLSRSPLAKPIINPSYTDFCPRNLNAISEKTFIDDFNQKKAIETAYAMVKEHPRLPRICLIHGPPGTGKSKTIVGLLYRILTERSGNENLAQNLNAKIKRNRVLVCAPSNAAVDELMKKIILEFKEKCQDRKNPLGNCGDINLVRLGPEKSISIDVLRFSLDSQVSHRMNRGQLGRDQDIYRKKEALDRQLDSLSRQRAMDRCDKRQKKMLNLSKRSTILRVLPLYSKVGGRPQEVQASIILESHIVCCTLSTSGGFLLESAFRRQGLDPFSCVIVDEAGQSCEVETLIPLIHRCSKLILVGDPKQLPPTVISMKAQEYGYDQSLMARLHKHLEEQVQQNVIGKLPVLQLTVQYRMHPDICLFPSNYIYGRTLKTDRATEENRCSSDWLFQPYLVFDVADGHEKRNNDSFANPQEVKLVMEIMKLIKEKKSDIGFRHIGIITPYSAQKKIIQQELDREFGRTGEVDTVDGFQGRQKDCIIVTCVRANSTQGSIGFLASLQRLNVTITRARYSLFILGRLTTLMENKDWNKLIQDAQRRGAIIKTCDKNYKRDAVKILKLKPTLQRPLSYPPTAAPSEKATQVQACLVRQPPESQALGSKGVTLPTSVQPAVRERPRDPRLARRAEVTGKEQASKNSNPSALSNPDVTLSRGPDASSAHWGPISTVQPTVSKAEDSNKPNQTVRQLEMPFAASHTSRQDHDWRVSVSSKEARTVSKEDQKGNEWCKDKDYRTPASRRASEQPPENKDLSEAKRRKVSY